MVQLPEKSASCLDSLIDANIAPIASGASWHPTGILAILGAIGATGTEAAVTIDEIDSDQWFL